MTSSESLRVAAQPVAHAAAWLRTKRWLRNLTAVLLASVLPALAALLRRRRRQQDGVVAVAAAGADAVAMAAAPPSRLLIAARSGEAVALLGADFVLPAPVPKLQDLLRPLLRGTAPPPQLPPCEELPHVGWADAVGDEEAELLVGDACRNCGRKGVARHVAEILRVAGRNLPAAAAAAWAASLVSRLDALAAAPFTAVLTAAWSGELEERFPHRVGRNFGGFATVLSKPRVDTPPGRARPAMHLWPGLVGAGIAGADGLPETREECERMLAAESPYLAFLRDLLRSKVVLLMGWPAVPPSGHICTALRGAWQEARARDPGRREPLAYILAAEGLVEAISVEECFTLYGLEVIRCSGNGGTEAFLRSLAKA